MRHQRCCWAAAHLLDNVHQRWRGHANSHGVASQTKLPHAAGTQMRETSRSDGHSERARLYAMVCILQITLGQIRPPYGWAKAFRWHQGPFDP